MLIRCFIVGVALLRTFFVCASPVGISAPFVDPTEFRSGSGNVLCLVDPSEKFGAGSAKYRVTKDGRELWAGVLPFTLYDAAVGADGWVCGFAYTDGWLGKFEGYLKEGIPGSLLIVSIDPSGKVAVQKRFPRSIRTNDLDTRPSIPWPEASRVEVDSVKGEFSMMMRGRTDGPPIEIRSFKLSTGEEVEWSGERPNWKDWHDPHEIKINREGGESEKVLLQAPTVELKLLKHVELKSDGKTVSQVQNTIAFGFDGQGRLGIVRAEEQRKYSFVLLDPNGTVLRTVPLEISKEETLPIEIAWLHDDIWAVTASTIIYFSNRSMLRQVDAKAGTVLRMPDLSEARPLKIGGDGADGLLTLNMYIQRGSAGWRLRYWPRLTEKPDKIETTITAESKALEEEDRIADFGITSNKFVVSLHTKPPALSYFNMAGESLATNVLAASWPSKFHPKALHVGSDLTKILGLAKSAPPDFARTEAIILTIKGERVIATNSFLPRFPDGQPFRASMAAFSRTGELWVCDENVLAKLDESGVVTKIPGSAAGAARLSKISTATIDQNGKVYAIDSETRAIHVFNSNGERLRVLKPKNAKENRNARSISVGDDGAIFVTGNRPRPCTVVIENGSTEFRPLKFALDEEEKGVVALKGDRLLALSYQGGGVFDRATKLVRSVDRQPDHKWLGNPSAAAVAMDGTVAVCSSPNWDLSRISTYTNDGEPIRTFPSIYGVTIGITKEFVIVGGYGQILFMDRVGKPLFKVRVGSDRGVDDLFVVNDEKELWMMHSRTMAIDQYAMPNREMTK